MRVTRCLATYIKLRKSIWAGNVTLLQTYHGLNKSFSGVVLSNPHTNFSQIQKINYDKFIHTISSQFDDYKFLRRAYHELEDEDSAQDPRERRREKGEAAEYQLVNTLMAMFGMEQDEALAVARYPKVRLVPRTSIEKTLQYLKKSNISSEQLQQMPWILLQHPDVIEEKFRVLSGPHLFLSPSDGLGFCQLPVSKIVYYQREFLREKHLFPNHNNRVYFMAERLMVPVDRLAEKMAKVKTVFAKDIHHINSMIDVMNKYGVHRDDILNDLWIFQNNIDMAEERLEAITSAGCKRPKLWTCRCPPEMFDRTLSRQKAKTEILGDCSSIDDYFAMRLDCSKERLYEITDYFVVKKINLPKVAKILDFLLAEGFTTVQILHAIRILMYSPERTAARIKLLKELGRDVSKISLSTLYKTKKEFEIYYEIKKN